MSTETEAMLVACVFCERHGKAIPWINVKFANPIKLVTNLIGPQGIRPISINAYLCDEHYKEQDNGDKKPQMEDKKDKKELN